MNSYWIESVQSKNIGHQIDNNYTSDVCIVGAGICGLSTAYYLSKSGLKVIVLDKDDVGKQVTGNTTAKITYQHGLIYNYLINTYGLDFSFAYLESNKKAISNIKQIIDNEQIECDFEHQNNYIYTTFQNELPQIQSEIQSLHMLSESERNVHFSTNLELPFKTIGAIENIGQAQFHPLKYIFGLSNCIQKNNGMVFSNSLVNNVKKENDYYLIHANNYTVKSKYLVLASHYPFINFPGFYFSKMYQSTSYVIAIDIGNKVFSGMYINVKDPIFSFRSAKCGNKKILLISGGNHKTGFAPNSSNGYSILEQKAKSLYPDCKILYKWNTHDCITLDKIPYIGDFSNIMPNMYVATGFNKWGMTSSNVAANIIKDKILGKKNAYEFVYNSTRFNPLKNAGEVSNMVSQSFKSFITNKINIPEKDLSSIKKNNGGILKINGSLVGIYRDSNDNLFAVEPKCTHLGCLLTWNNLSKTWDCPCHGSRFDYTGENIHDPAFKSLKKYDI